MLNLLSNAIKLADRGEVTLRAEISLPDSAGGQSVRLAAAGQACWLSNCKFGDVSIENHGKVM